MAACKTNHDKEQKRFGYAQKCKLFFSHQPSNQEKLFQL